MLKLLQRYLLPAFVFQSVLVGGGYGTGREIAEFFLSHGARGGLIGFGVAGLVWGVILAIAFEFARITGHYEYRGFFRALIGPAWRLYELIFILITFIVLAVIGSAAGEMFALLLNVPPFVGTLVLLVSIGVLSFYGSALIEKILSSWSIVLFAVYAIFLVIVFAESGDVISVTLAEGEIKGAWWFDALKYAGYNLVVLAPVLFTLRHIETRNEALAAGFIAGVIGVVPGIIIFLAMLAQYPEIVNAPVPVAAIIDGLESRWISIPIQIVLFGTFIETGAGIIHSVNERVGQNFIERGKSFPSWMRVVIAIILLLAATFLAERVGIIGLISKGYDALSYAFIAVVVIPLMTIGVYRIWKANCSESVTGLSRTRPG